MSGLPNIRYFTFSDFEIHHAYNGRPKIVLTSHLETWCKEREIFFDVSISHSDVFASATVLLYVKGDICED